MKEFPDDSYTVLRIAKITDTLSLKLLHATSSEPNGLGGSFIRHYWQVALVGVDGEWVTEFPVSVREPDVKAFAVKVFENTAQKMGVLDDMVTTKYTQCKHCDHFVDDNTAQGEGIAANVHLEDGEQEFDHDAEPGETKTMAEWQAERPDLFKMHPDGKIGPNSIYHSQRGKDNRHM